MKHQNVDVEIYQGWWDVTIVIRPKTGEEIVYVASADSYYTDHDGIWFGTEAELEEA